MEITNQQLLLLIGQKEIDLYSLRIQLKEKTQELEDLKIRHELIEGQTNGE